MAELVSAWLKFRPSFERTPRQVRTPGSGADVAQRTYLIERASNASQSVSLLTIRHSQMDFSRSDVS